MTILTPQRVSVEQEELQFGAAVSEGTFSKMGASLNFMNSYYYQRHTWNLNGDFGTLYQSGEEVDGRFVFPVNVELCAFTMSIGTRKTTQVDILRYTSPTDTGGSSLFGTKPILNSTAFYMGVTLIDSDGIAQTSVEDSEIASGSTAPTFVSGNCTMDKFDSVGLEVTSQVAGAKDLSVTIYFRPR